MEAIHIYSIGHTHLDAVHSMCLSVHADLFLLVSKTTAYHSQERRGLFVATAFWTRLICAGSLWARRERPHLSHQAVRTGFGKCPERRVCDASVWIKLNSRSGSVLQILLLIFSCLRKAAWDYGRLALLMGNDRWIRILFWFVSHGNTLGLSVEPLLSPDHEASSSLCWVFMVLRRRRSTAKSSCSFVVRGMINATVAMHSSIWK